MPVPRGVPAVLTLLLLAILILPALPLAASRTSAVAAAPVERMAITATMVNLRQHPTPLARIDRILRLPEFHGPYQKVQLMMTPAGFARFILIWE